MGRTYLDFVVDPIQMAKWQPCCLSSIKIYHILLIFIDTR